MINIGTNDNFTVTEVYQPNDLVNVKCGFMQSKEHGNATELTRTYEERICKVVEVRPNACTFDFAYDESYPFIVRPISLSEKILTDNDFIYNKEMSDDTWKMYNLRSYPNLLFAVGTVTTVVAPKANYVLFICQHVHELQHLLRHFSLNSIADNLKVE